jgi:HSP20 family protein
MTRFESNPRVRVACAPSSPQHFDEVLLHTKRRPIMTESQPTSVEARDPFQALDPFRTMFRPFADTSALRNFFRDNGEVWAPPLDVSETEDHFVVTMELAGARKEDVTVECHENMLTIRGEKRSERTEEKEQRRYFERRFGAFSRSFTLPSNANPESVDAKFNEGVLTVEIAKREEAKPKTIAVK